MLKFYDDQAKSARNFDIYDAYKAGGVTYKSLGEKYGITAERVRQIIGKIDRIKARRERYVNRLLVELIEDYLRRKENEKEKE